MNCSDSQIPRDKSLFNQHDSSLGRHVNAKSSKKLRNSSVVYHKSKNPIGAKICMNVSFQLL